MTSSVFPRRWAWIVALAFTGCVLGACGHSSSRGTPSNAGNVGDGGAPAQPPRPAPPRYVWSLPVGDVSPNESEQDVYGLLHAGRCSAAQRLLDSQPTPDEPGRRVWRQFASPRNVLLAQAAIEFCRGDLNSGTLLYRRAEALGWEGLLPVEDGDGPSEHASCEYYRSLSSIITQRARTAFDCPRGTPPPWDESSDETNRPDPRR